MYFDSDFEIDIIICSYNEVESLNVLFESFMRQTINKQKFRIIFVDNNSTDNTQIVVKNYQTFLNIHYVFEKREGKSFALNTGYSLARTEYVAQTDADCKVSPDWIEKILLAIKNDSPDCLCGPFFPYYKLPKPYWYLDKYNSSCQGNQRKNLLFEHPCGSNMILKRQLITNINGYNTDLCINKKDIVGGEDTEIINRLRIIYPDLKVIYYPNIIVYHLTKEKCFDLFHECHRSYLTGLRANKIFYSNSLHRNHRKYIYLRLIKQALTVFLHFIIVGLLFRNRSQYPFIQNYIYEKLRPDLYKIGEIVGDLQCP